MLKLFLTHIFLLLSLLSVFVVSNAQSLNDNDAFIMAILKEAIDTSSDLNWTDSNVCNWNHIQCNDSGDVTAIQLGSLNLRGLLPKELVQLTHLQTFNCSYNGFFGPVPYMPTSLQMLSINNNNFDFMPTDFFLDMVNLLEVRVSTNPFNRWVVPSSLEDCVSLKSFYGSNVSFVGKITSFAIFKNLHSLVLANNSFTGTIPIEFTRLSQLKELDVSNNKLSGKVPLFSPDVHVKVSGNTFTVMSHGGSGFSGDNSGGKGKKDGVGAGVIVGIVAGVVILLGLVALLFKFGRKHEHGNQVQSPNAIELQPRHSGDGNDLNISVAGGGGGGIGAFGPSSSVQNAETDNMVISLQVLRQATDNFSERNRLGKGGFGTVYKGELHDGTKIAVKRMESGIMGAGQKGLNEFKAEIAVLTKVRHRNLVALLGHCLDGNERLLVYEYMSQGPLSTHLFKWKEHEGSRPLDWKTRLLIALDVARGIEYLHSLAQQTFIHRDLKPSNILLGDDMRAKISDFGLVRLAPEGQASFVTNVAGTFGYMSPEYAVSGRVTTKVDVYGYGVILMEMITGRKAVDDSQPEDDVHIVPWFRRMLLNQDSLEKAIDPTIDVDGEADSLRAVAELAGHCCTREPYRRPDMSQVVNVLAPLVEIWNPISPASTDDTDFHMTLPEALNRWRALEGMGSNDASSSAQISTEYNTARDA